MTLLLTTVLANPHDPMRGALSDHWTEYGVPPVVLPDGQVIEPGDPRVVYRPGDAVPWGFRCTMAEWCGERCFICGGHHPEECGNCQGGVVGDIAAAVCGAWPIVGVELADVSTWGVSSDNCFLFWRMSAYEGSHPDDGNLPDKLFGLIAELYPKNCVSLSDQTRRAHRIRFSTKSAAIAALSRAALTYGRRTAGLPDLQFINHKQEQ